MNMTLTTYQKKEAIRLLCIAIQDVHTDQFNAANRHVKMALDELKEE